MILKARGSRARDLRTPPLATSRPSKLKAYTPTSDVRGSDLSRLREFRNRIGHHHRIWSEDIAGRYGDLLDVSGFLDPSLRTFIDRRSRLSMLLDDRP